jgi:hypothetical protein
MARPPPRTGTVAAIGAYLDLVPGKKINRGIVTKWVNKFRNYVVTVCETSRINLIFEIILEQGWNHLTPPTVMCN